ARAVRCVPHDARRQRAGRADPDVGRRPAALEPRQAPAHQGLHAAVRRQRRGCRGAGPAAALGARRSARRVRRAARIARDARADRALARRGRDRRGGRAAMMWPFDASTESLWLALYLVSFALHAVLVSYVAAGAVYALVAALRRSADPIAERTRDWLPFLLGAGITAGIGPLLFLQLLYQRRFYTANLLMGPRWGAVVPALILGFYALYLAKASEHRRRLALGAGAACFGFVAWSWTELHQVMLDDAGWRAMYAAGERFHLDAAVLPRLAIWAGAMLALFATVAAWPASAAERRRLAALALTGLIICGATSAIALAIRRDFDPAHGWTYLLGIAAIA